MTSVAVVRFVVGVLVVGVLVVTLASCGGEASADDRLVIFAAASLTDVFADLADDFQQANPGVEVVVNAAGSSDLATQIVEGAPADVFASADMASMDRVVEAGLADGEPQIFAVNRLEIMVESGNPLGIAGVDDLADAGIVLVTCAPQVPCGHYAREMFAAAGVDVTPDSYEVNVRAVVTKVVAGEADAGIAYATDVRQVAGDADGVPIPPAINVEADYPIVSLLDAADPSAATAFVEYVRSERGRSTLQSSGFETR